MNEYVKKLYTIARKRHRLIVGLMSGTSLDGLDVALCRVEDSGPQTKLDVLRFDTKAYSNAFRNQIRQVFAKRTIDQQALCGLHAWIGQTHGALINESLRAWGVSPGEVDLIASHGQTVFHAPQSATGSNDYPNSTLQIGDGDHLAIATGIITISDFRQKHVAAGGEGAPLAAYGDYLLFANEHEPRVLLNIGGIANFTLLPNTGGSEYRCFATDVGPGNTLMDQYMLAHFGMEMDRGAHTAASGSANERLLLALLNHRFFALPFPKTTGPELFNLQYLTDAQEASGTESLSENDVMATLSAFSAAAIVSAVRRAAQPHENLRVYVSGGGLHNPLLISRIREGLTGMAVAQLDELGILPDAKEAALFAVLANETVAGKATTMAVVSGAPAVCMGKISFPN